MFEVQVLQEALDPEQEQRRLRRRVSGVGALAVFVGIMRDLNQGREIREMFLEHYPGMTEKVLRVLLEQARSRWALRSGVILHRVGLLRPEDPIVLVAVGSEHRGDAFRACEFLIDALKTEAPLWKRERTPSGERWVQPREEDRVAGGRWTMAEKDLG